MSDLIKKQSYRYGKAAMFKKQIEQIRQDMKRYCSHNPDAFMFQEAARFLFLSKEVLNQIKER